MTASWLTADECRVSKLWLQNSTAQMFLISSRSVVYANAHAMAHDERIYGAPHDFNPDRYAPRTDGGQGEPFPVGNFGFGRR